MVTVFPAYSGYSKSSGKVLRWFFISSLEADNLIIEFIDVQILAELEREVLT